MLSATRIGVSTTLGQCCIINPRNFLAALHLRFEHIELGQQHGGLHRIQPPIHADPQHLIARRALAMRPQRAIQRRPFSRFGEQRAAIAISAQRLGGEKTRRRRIRGLAQPLALQLLRQSSARNHRA